MSFVYARELDADSLQQGDVLRRTDGLNTILAEVHPHYLKPDYRFFIVLTQTCDLVRRNGESAKAPYITIAAVRPFERAVERYAQRLLRDELEERLGFASEERKARVRQFIERLLNNNEPEYFYLHQFEGSVLAEENCAFLQLSIALKAPLHYDTLLAAKIQQLSDSFQHKLGHLVGTSYSRVGTEDWVPRHASPERFNRMVSEHLERVPLLWLERKVYERALKSLRELPPHEQTLQRLEAAVQDAARTKEQKKKDVLDIVVKVATGAGIDTTIAQRLATRLGNDPGFMKSL